MVAFHNTQQSNTSRAAGGGNSSAFVELRMGASTMRRALPSFPTDAYDEGAAIHRHERHPPSPGDKIGGRARLGWWWRAHSGGESVTIWRLFFRGAPTMRSAFE